MEKKTWDAPKFVTLNVNETKQNNSDRRYTERQWYERGYDYYWVNGRTS